MLMIFVITLIHRMDPNSSYLLEIRLFGNPKKTRKDCSSFVIEKVLDSDTTNFKDFVEWMVDKHPPSVSRS